MKRFLLFLFVILLPGLHTSAQTSVYHPFPDSNAVWGANYYFMCNASGAYENDFFSYVMTGDTVIGSNTYHKLFIPYLQHAGAGTLCPFPVGYAGAFRNIISLKIVLYVPPGQSNEELLYDFNLQNGDLFYGYLSGFCAPFDVRVVLIDSILIGSDYRKRWHFTDTSMASFYQFEIIEGIGNVRGLFGLPCTGTANDGADLYTTCYQENGVPLYFNPLFNFTDCHVINDLKELGSTQYKTRIIPNPFHDFAIFYFGTEFGSDNHLSLLIYDIRGRLEDKLELMDAATSIARKNLRDGIYFYDLRNSSNEILDKGRFILN